MKPHPDFATRVMPTHATLGLLAMEPLTAEHLDEDYRNVMASERVIKGVFGGSWPEGLTLAENATDLHWHAREFSANRSFAWVLRDADGVYVGCAYLYPDIGRTGAGTAVYWVVDRPDRLALLADFGPCFRGWLVDLLPRGYALEMVCNDGLPGPDGGDRGSHNT